MRHGETILFDLINDLSYINILRDGHAHRHIFFSDHVKLAVSSLVNSLVNSTQIES